MPFRMTKRLEVSDDGCVVRLSAHEVASMGMRPGDTVDVEVWPASHHLERIPL